jgi:hypothetical protein
VVVNVPDITNLYPFQVPADVNVVNAEPELRVQLSSRVLVLEVLADMSQGRDTPFDFKATPEAPPNLIEAPAPPEA